MAKCKTFEKYRARGQVRSRLPLLLVVSALVLAGGCRRASPPTVVTTSSRPAEESIVSATEILRGGADLNAWRNYLQQLNHYLGSHPDSAPRSLTPQEQRFFMQNGLLDKSELAELASAAFTPLDAHYLELAFLLREAVRALDVAEQPPLKRVAQGFAWVMRQVRLQQSEGPTVPPLLVLRRGWGTARERALVFLALLDQLGIDGCMIGLPADMPGQAGLRDWAPGACIDQEIYLFDTRLGLPLPGPKGEGIATLKQVRAGLDLRQILTIQEKYPYDVGPETAQRAEVEVAYSLSSLAPRMEFLQNYLAGTEKIRLAVAPQARWQHLQEVAGGVRIWNAPGDNSNSLRVLRAFLPPEEGGVAQQPLREIVRQQVVPWQEFPPQLRLPGEPGHRLQAIFAAPFYYFSLETRMPPELLQAWLPGLSEASVDKPGTRRLSETLQNGSLPRDLLLRGRPEEAAALLVTIREQLEKQKLHTVNPKLEQAVQQWAQQVVEAHSDLIRAEQSANTSAVAAAKERVNQLWTVDSGPAMGLLQIASAGPMLERVVYLLALCKQEQAERLQSRQDEAARHQRAASPAETKARADAWKVASSWWASYLNDYAAAPAAPTARQLRARAVEQLGSSKDAAALLANLDGVALDLEKTARLYLAKQLQSRSP